jgi:hypothetical protein
MRLPDLASAESGLGPVSASVPIMEEEEDVEDADDGLDMNTDGVDLAWALRPRASPLARSGEVPIPFATEQETLQAMRREIANLQLDMLRMGRGLKVSLEECRLWVVKWRLMRAERDTASSGTAHGGAERE